MLEIIPVPILSDNYCWLITSEGRDSVYVVDPGEAHPVVEALQKHDFKIEALLITHSHWDHIDGIDEVLSYQQAPVIGPLCLSIPRVTEVVNESSKLKLWGEIDVQIFETPGHLPEHICFYFEDGNNKHLMCGDVLFSSGCGRNFVGSSEEFHGSLSALAKLPPDTKFYCAHEYTLANLKFAQTVEPNNNAIKAKQEATEKLRGDEQPSLPSTIGSEIETNPFMRCHHADVRKAAEQYAGQTLSKASEVFGALRKWKDAF